MKDDALVKSEPTTTDMALKPKQVIEQVQLIQEMMKQVMKPGVHYGTIPGCGDKPSLFKAGAEKLLFTFRLKALVNPEEDITVTDMGNDHREYVIITHIVGPTGVELATGLGSCCTKESKYRWRNAQRVCPECGKQTIIKGKEEYGGGWLCFAKKGGCGAKFVDNDKAITSQVQGRIENEDIADCYNTCLKIAKKRSVVDGTISATAASDVLTQDLEDLDEKLKKYATSEVKVEPPEPEHGTTTVEIPPVEQSVEVIPPDKTTAKDKIAAAKADAKKRTGKESTKKEKKKESPAELAILSGVRPAEEKPADFEPVTGVMLTDAKVDKIVGVFKKYDIDLTLLEKWRKLTVDEWTESVRAELLNLYKGVKAGDFDKKLLEEMTEEEDSF